jgi:hypothetical protein
MNQAERTARMISRAPYLIMQRVPSPSLIRLPKRIADSNGSCGQCLALREVLRSALRSRSDHDAKHYVEISALNSAVEPKPVSHVA